MPLSRNNTGSTLYQGMTWRRRIRVERAARLVASGLWSNEQIANQLGIHPQTLVYMKQTRQFQAAMIEIRTGIISQENAVMSRSIEEQREELLDMVPIALLKLREHALSANPAISLKASTEILDREGSHSKVSRTSVTVTEKVDLNATNNTARNILDILRAEPGAANGAGAAPEFTRSAASAKEQINMMADAINEHTLEQIDLSKATRQ